MDVVSRQLLERGRNSMEAGMFEEAVTCFQSLTDNDPRNWTAARLLGVAYLGTGNIIKARHELTYVVEQCPDSHERELARQALKKVLADKVPHMPTAHWSMHREVHLDF